MSNVREKEITHIGVDVGGVIIPYLDNIIDNQLARDLSLNRDTFDVIWREHVVDLIIGSIDYDTFWMNIGNRLKVNTDCAKSNLITLFQTYATENEQLIKYLLKLREDRGVMLVGISNSIQPHSQHNYDTGLYDLFDRVYLSNEIGYAKPAKRFFEYILHDLEIKPSQMLFIDDIARNVEAAQNIGIACILHEDNGVTMSGVGQYLEEGAA